MKQTKRYKLGELELSDSVYVSDPCYDPGTWCQALVDNLKPGKYIGYMKKAYFGPGGFGGIRVTDLRENVYRPTEKSLVKYMIP